MLDLLRAVLAFCLLLVLAAVLPSQTDETSETIVAVEPVMVLDARGQVATSMVQLPAGPLFALAPIADRVGIPLTVGPLGDRHSLALRDQEVLVGPDVATIAVLGQGEGEQLIAISQPPRRSVDGLMVPLDFLERTIGDARGLVFRWNAPIRRLEIAARDERLLSAQVLQIRQGPVTTIEITFSETPRYRVDRFADGLALSLLGDRLELRQPFVPDPADARVRQVVIDPSSVRIVLADNAAAAEPRLLGSPPRLVVEVFRRRSTVVKDESVSDAAGSTRGAGGGLRTIVLDPGHGGEETGAISASGLVEKDLTLWFARSLARRLERRLPVRVLLTRDDDHDIPLDSRTAFANQHKADLFISLHLNSWFGKGAHGAETYFLSRSASDQRAAETAAFDNRASSDAGDPELGLELILWDLAQSHHLAESQRFARLVQGELNDSLGLTDRGVKQAPFRVLLGAAMPAVVVELGFLSNPDEAARLQDLAYRGELVDSLVRAIMRFKTQIDASDVDGVGDAPAGEAEAAGDRP